MHTHNFIYEFTDKIRSICLGLAYFIQHDLVSFIFWQMPWFLYSCMKFHCAMYHFFKPFNCGWISGLVISPGYCEHCSFNHVPASLWRVSVRVLQIFTQESSSWVIWWFQFQFFWGSSTLPLRLHKLTFPPALNECSSLLIASPALCLCLCWGTSNLMCESQTLYHWAPPPAASFLENHANWGKMELQSTFNLGPGMLNFFFKYLLAVCISSNELYA